MLETRNLSSRQAMKHSKSVYPTLARYRCCKTEAFWCCYFHCPVAGVVETRVFRSMPRPRASSTVTVDAAKEPDFVHENYAFLSIEW